MNLCAKVGIVLLSAIIVIKNACPGQSAYGMRRHESSRQAVEAPRALGRSPGVMSPLVAISFLNATGALAGPGCGERRGRYRPEITSVSGQIFARDT